jgi:4-hydroxy-4-methyl-2-oxoglutarate aldolase
MNDMQISRALGKFPTGNLSNAHREVRAMHSALAPLFQGARIAGPARTARVPLGENAAIHRAVHTAMRGDVLVVDSAGDRTFGPFGDILAACCRNQGVAGLVIDGTIRDTADIKDMRFPVFCLGANPTATAKSDPGEIDIEIECGGVRVRPGDFIAGDDDGVVVVPREIAQAVIEKAGVVARREEAIKARLSRGETTLEIFEINPAAHP